MKLVDATRSLTPNIIGLTLVMESWTSNKVCL